LTAFFIATVYNHSEAINWGKQYSRLRDIFMRILVSLMVLVSSFFLVCLGLRIPPAQDTYWMLTHIVEDTPDWHGYYLMSPNGDFVRKIDSRTAISGGRWFLGWSADGRYLIYEHFRRTENSDEGIQVLDLKTGKRTWIFQGDLKGTPTLLQPSPDGKTFALVISYPKGIDTLYTFAADGSHLRELVQAEIKTDYPVSWSKDSAKIYFYQIEPATPEIYQIQRDGTGYAPMSVESQFQAFYRVDSPDKTRYLTLTPEGYWQLYDTQTETLLETLSYLEKNMSVVAWLPNERLVLREIITGAENEILSARLWVVRLDGSDEKTLVEGRYIFAFSDERTIYAEVTTLEQIYRVVAIDKDTLASKVIIPNYNSSLFALPRTNDFNQPFTFIWVKEENWFIWSDSNNLYRMHSDGSETRKIYTHAPGIGETTYHLSLDGKWLIINYMETPSFNNPDRKIVRVRLSDGHQEMVSSSNHQLLSISPIFRATYHPYAFVGGGVFLIGLVGITLLGWTWHSHPKI
jgi:hypothetical protein